MLYFFMRKYQHFSPKTLVATLTALAGGPVLTVLERWAAGGDPKLGLWYFLGVGVGFFAYANYVGVLSILYTFGRIKSRHRFEVAASCGAGIADELGKVELLIDFEQTVKKWDDGKLDEEAFSAALTTIGFSRNDYLRAKRGNDLEFDLDTPLLERFESGGYLELLPDK
jgi:hypothetical protein